MTTTWAEPAAVLAEQACGPDGVWMLVYAAGHAAMNLAAAPGGDDELGLTYAALDTSRAFTELELGLVDYADTGVAVDLGPVRLSDRSAAITVIHELLEAAESLIATLVAQPGVRAPAVLCATRVALHLTSARANASGGAW